MLVWKWVVQKLNGGSAWDGLWFGCSSQQQLDMRDANFSSAKGWWRYSIWWRYISTQWYYESKEIRRDIECSCDSHHWATFLCWSFPSILFANFSLFGMIIWSWILSLLGLYAWMSQYPYGQICTHAQVLFFVRTNHGRLAMNIILLHVVFQVLYFM